MTLLSPFLEGLARGSHVADGPMGTALFARGVPYERCYEELCISEPRIVLDVHRSYAKEGATLLRANTFGANRFRLTRHGLEDRVREINTAAVTLLGGEGFRGGAYVAASMGPTGLSAKDVAREQRAVRAAFHEQAEALADTGCDAIVLETFRDSEEARLAVDAAVSVPGAAPVLALVTVDARLRMSDGVPLADLARRLLAAGAVGVGVNCIERLGLALDALAELVPLGAPVAIFPSAGLPRRDGARLVYPTTPAQLGAFASRALASGAAIVGGCCGATSEHVARMSRSREAAAPSPPPTVGRSESELA